jgi:hypothetical protein
MRNEWTVQAQRRLVELMASDQDLTYKQAAAIMTAEFDFKFTKNSCIGKGRRLGIPPRKPIDVYQLRDDLRKWLTG